MAEPEHPPFFSESVAAGFPSPTTGEINGTLDLNQLCVRHPAATYFVRVRGNSMTGASIDDGDILVVDRSLTPTHGNIVIAAIAGEFTVKRLEQRNGKHWLVPANPDYAPVEISQEEMANIFGVVTYAIKAMANNT